MRRAGAVGCRLSAAGACGVSRSSSSSNGRSNRSDMGEIVQLLGAVAETFDVGREAGLLVSLDDHGVQSWIAGGGLEFLRHRGEKAPERSADLDADDRIVRT